jgi:hypothetical protein
MHCGSKSAAHELPIIRVLQMGSGSILKIHSYRVLRSLVPKHANPPISALFILLNGAGAPESNASFVLLKIHTET